MENASMKNLTLEHGTILSDTLSLTPLINASFMSNYSATSNKSQSVAKKLSNSKMLTNEKIAKIFRIGNDANIQFPTINLGSSSSAELTLSNPTKDFVRWKSFSVGAALIRPADKLEDKLDDVTNILQVNQCMLKSSYSVFTVIPTSGMIPPMQKQVLKIEFNPRESN